MNSLQASLLELDLPVRLELFVICHVLLFVWARRIVAHARVGASRLLCSAPVIPVLVFLTLLFDVNSTAEFIPVLYCTHNFLWLTATKLLAFCFNRGQLVRSYETGSNTAFALSLLFPITVDVDVKPIEKGKEFNGKHPHAYKDAQFSLPTFTVREILHETVDTVIRMAAKVILLVSMHWGYHRFAESNHPFWRDVCSSWIFYGVTSFVEDLTGLVLMLTLEIKTATSFDCPWMAPSVTELWSRRYNLVFGRTLRDIIYDPICEGSLVHGQNYFNKQKPSVIRRLTGVLLTFGASALIHVFGMQQSFKSDPMINYGLFFVINGIIVVLENVLKLLVKSSGYKTVISSLVQNWMYHVYSITVVFTLAHWFFWPDLNAVGGAEMLANGSIAFLKNLKLLP